MTTLEEVVYTLIEQTKEGQVRWEAYGWDDEATPTHWRTTAGGCIFRLLGREKRLDMDTKTIGRGEGVEKLAEAIASLPAPEGTTLPEVLAQALDCLKGDKGA